MSIFAKENNSLLYTLYLRGLTLRFRSLTSVVYIQLNNIIRISDEVTIKIDLPFEFGQPRRIPETFGKRIAVDFQLGYL